MRTGAWLALFALALQFTLSFGHFHPGHHESGHHDSAHHDGAPSASHHAAASGDGAGSPEPHGNADEECAACAVLQRVGSLLLSAPPTLALPVEFNPVVRPVAAAPALNAALRVAFQSRAPPIA